jgi:hypothetical protein
MNSIIIILMREVITKTIYYLNVEMPYLDSHNGLVKYNSQNHLLIQAYKTPNLSRRAGLYL